MENKNDYQTLQNKFGKFMYVEERNKKGHIIIELIRFIKPSYKNQETIFIQYAMFVILKAMEISQQNNNNNNVIVHVNMVGTTRDNFSLKFFKTVNFLLEEAFPDEILEVCYVYSKSKLASILWKIIKPIVNSVSREKYKIINIK